MREIGKNIYAILGGVFIFLIALAAYFYGPSSSKKAIDLKNETPAIPEIVEEKPEIPSIAVGTELLGKAALSYAGGTEGRGKNIQLGIARLSGKIIMPGEEFSFTDALGTTTVEDGFSVERIFLNGEVTKGIGGGLCQVSSLLFQTVLSAGLPVTERHNHSYTVSYYDVGLDATYSDPGPDLKFVNDTAHPILIKGRTQDETAIFEIYGTSDGRIASTTEAEIVDIVDAPKTRYVYLPQLEEGEPECINTPQIGYTAKVKYGVMSGEGEYKEQIFESKYKPLQRVCRLVGVEGIAEYILNIKKP